MLGICAASQLNDSMLLALPGAEQDVKNIRGQAQPWSGGILTLEKKNIIIIIFSGCI